MRARLARGIARNTVENKRYLGTCDAVETVIELDDMIEFKFDPQKQPPREFIPDGVFFDLTEAPF